MSQNLPPFVWARLNADGLFLALLAIASGLFGLVDGVDGTALAVAVRATGYVVGGLLVLLGLIREIISPEIVGRFVIMGTVMFQIWRRWIEDGFASTETQSVIVLFVIVAATSGLRASALLSKEAITFTVPPARRRRSGGDRG